MHGNPASWQQSRNRMPEVSHAPSPGLLPEKQLIQTHLPHLTQTQLTGLAWWRSERLALAVGPTSK